MSKGNHPALTALIELLDSAKGFYTGIEELDLLEEIVKKGLNFKSYLMQILHDADSYHGEDHSVMYKSLLVALKATSAAGLYDHQVSHNVELVLSRYSWKKQIHKLLCGGKKTSIQQVLRLDKEDLLDGSISRSTYRSMRSLGQALKNLEESVFLGVLLK